MEDLMQTVPIQNALDMMLKHDVIRIIFGKSKGRISEKTKRGMIHYRAAIIRKDLRVTALFCKENSNRPRFFNIKLT